MHKKYEVFLSTHKVPGVLGCFGFLLDGFRPFRVLVLSMFRGVKRFGVRES